jgi:hypothetical protein
VGICVALTQYQPYLSLPFVYNQTLTGGDRVSEQRPLFDVCPTRVSLSHSIGQTTRLRAFAPSSLFMWMKTLVERANERASAHTAVRSSICLCKLAMHIYTQPASKREELVGWMDEAKRMSPVIRGPFMQHARPRQFCNFRATLML